MKKGFLLMMLIALCLGLVACGGPGNPDETSANADLELAVVNIQATNYWLDKGTYRGAIIAEITCPEAGDYTLSSKRTGDVTVSLSAGTNAVTLPCSFDAIPDAGSMFIKMSLTGTVGSFNADMPMNVTYEPLDLKLTSPGYRNNFYPGQDSSKIAGNVPAGLDVTVRLEGDGIPAQEIQVDTEGNFSFDTPNFKEGCRATLTAVINGCEITKEIRCLEARNYTMTWIENGTLVVDGEPVIRRNIYSPTYHVSAPNKEKYFADELHESDAFVQVSLQIEGFPGASTSGHETTLDVYPSEETLRRIDQVIASNKMKNFGYYYLSDEPELRKFSKVYMQYVYEYIAEKDPYHVVLICTEDPSEYFNCADWIETDPYLGPLLTTGERTYSMPMHLLGRYVSFGTKLNRADKCVGMIPKTYSIWPGYKGNTTRISDYHTFDEYICNVWTGFNNGAKSMWSYAGHDLHDRASLYEGSRYVYSSIEALEELLAVGKRTVLVDTVEVEAVLWETDTEKMFVVANMTNEEKTFTIDGVEGTWDNFRNEGTITGNTFTLEPFGVLIGTSVPKDEGLPSYGETEALIDQLEAERQSSESLLFGMLKYYDYDIESSIRSTAHPADHKLNDGVLDNYAWKENGAMTHYLEFKFLSTKVTMKKVVIYGANLDTLQFFVRYDGELEEPSISDMDVTETKVTIWLSEAITPDSFRLEFNDPLGNDIFLYEIEVF